MWPSAAVLLLTLRLLRFSADWAFPVIQGYGMTETSPIISGNNVTDNDPATVGRALKDVSIRLGEREEIQIKATSS